MFAFPTLENSKQTDEVFHEALNAPIARTVAEITETEIGALSARLVTGDKDGVGKGEKLHKDASEAENSDFEDGQPEAVAAGGVSLVLEEAHLDNKNEDSSPPPPPPKQSSVWLRRLKYAGGILLFKVLLNPPLIGIMVGIFIGLTPAMQSIFVVPNAPLSFLMDASTVSIYIFSLHK